MKKKIFVFLLALMCIVLMQSAALAEDIAVNASNFPDDVFRGIINDEFDANSDGMLSASEIAAVTEMDISDMAISDLTGIKHFTSLEKLLCDRNSLTELDVSNMTSLKYLSCAANYINVGGSYIYTLNTLDVSGCSELSTLYCGPNVLTQLDLSGLSKLKDLSCMSNKITELDVSENTELVYLRCGDNNITSLDVSGFDKLEEVYCQNCPNLEGLDLSGCTELKALQCHNTSISALDIGACAELEYISCSNADISALDVRNNPKIYSLICHGNPLESLRLNAGLSKVFEDGELYYDPSELRDVYMFAADVEEYAFLSIPAGFDPDANGQAPTPDTGDSSRPALWTALLFVSAAGAAAITYRERRAGNPAKR